MIDEDNHVILHLEKMDKFMITKNQITKGGRPIVTHA